MFSETRKNTKIPAGAAWDIASEKNPEQNTTIYSKNKTKDKNSAGLKRKKTRRIVLSTIYETQEEEHISDIEEETSSSKDTPSKTEILGKNENEDLESEHARAYIERALNSKDIPAEIIIGESMEYLGFKLNSPSASNIKNPHVVSVADNFTCIADTVATIKNSSTRVYIIAQNRAGCGIKIDRAALAFICKNSSRQYCPPSVPVIGGDV